MYIYIYYRCVCVSCCCERMMINRTKSKKKTYNINKHTNVGSENKHHKKLESHRRTELNKKVSKLTRPLTLPSRSTHTAQKCFHGVVKKDHFLSSGTHTPPPPKKKMPKKSHDAPETRCARVCVAIPSILDVSLHLAVYIHSRTSWGCSHSRKVSTGVFFFYYIIENHCLKNRWASTCKRSFFYFVSHHTTAVLVFVLFARKIR